MRRKIGSAAISQLPPSQTVAMSLRAAALQKEGKNIIKLSGGEPDFRTPAPIVQAAKDALDAGRTHYALGIGIEALRRRIAEKMKAENNISASPDQIVVTPGGKFALYFAMQALINPGDEVILVTPAWVSYEPIIMAAGGVAVPVEVSADNGYKVTRDMLDQAVTEKTKLLIICTPNNPTGHVVDEDEARVIAGFLKDTGVYCLTDEIYERLTYGKNAFSIGSLPEVADQVITLMGFSKGYAMTGWRLAWLAVPEDLMKLFKTLYSQSLSCTPTFIQDAAVHAFDCAEDVERMRLSYMERGRKFTSLLNEIPGVRADMPEGAFYAWVRFDKAGMNASDMAEYLLDKAGVAGVAGIAFGDTENRYMRFSFAQAEEDLLAAAARIKEAVEAL